MYYQDLNLGGESILDVESILVCYDNASADFENAKAELEEAREAHESRDTTEDTDDTLSTSDEVLQKFEENLEEAEEVFNYWNNLREELSERGGDIRHRGEWFPRILIEEDHFIEYARDLATELDLLGNTQWPHNCIDWEEAAKELQSDYACIDIGGCTYWFR